jgi:hypothetical protein
VVPKVGGGEDGGIGARRAERGVSAAVPVILSVRSGRPGSLGRGAAGGSPGWLHAGLDPGLPAEAAFPLALGIGDVWWKKSRTCTKVLVLLSISSSNQMPAK